MGDEERRQELHQRLTDSAKETRELREERQKLKEETAKLRVRPQIYDFCIHYQKDNCLLGNGPEASRINYCYTHVNFFLDQILKQIKEESQ